MPYSPAQCRKFAAMAARGKQVPADWRHHCTKRAQKKRVKAGRKR